MNYYISDLHLFHENSIKFDNRPFKNIQEMHETIREKWNSKITNGDTVYILGDVSLRGTKEELIAFVSTLKGKKILVKGNHDDVSDYRYQQLFEEICDYKEIRDSYTPMYSDKKENEELILCHYPILSWKKMGRGSILLYGHTHDSEEDEYFQKCLQGMSCDVCRHLQNHKPIAINVGCMKSWINYEPRSLTEIIQNNFMDIIEEPEPDVVYMNVPTQLDISSFISPD